MHFLKSSTGCAGGVAELGSCETHFTLVLEYTFDAEQTQNIS